MRTNILFLVVVGLTVVAGALAYPHMPAQVISHWDAAGQANGHMGRFWGTFLMPLILLVLFVLYVIIPHIDPLKQNLAAFRKPYDVMWLGIAIFMAYIYALTLGQNLGWRFNFTAAMVPALAALFMLIGWLLKRSRRNWFVGIRTPWTLSDDHIWDATHRLGGKLFVIAGIIILGSLLFPQAFIWFVLLPLLVAAIVPIVYSYVLYRRLNH